MNYQFMAEILLYITVDDDLDTPSRLDLRHDLQDFVKDNPGKYEIRLFDDEGRYGNGKPTVII